MNYSTEGMQTATEREAFFANFFHNVKALLRSVPVQKKAKWGPREKELNDAYDDLGCSSDNIPPPPLLLSPSRFPSLSFSLSLSAFLPRFMRLSFVAKREEVHHALADNFNTPLVMSLLGELVSKVNGYLAGPEPHIYLLRSVADYVTGIFKVSSRAQIAFFFFYRDVASSGSDNCTLRYGRCSV